MAEAGFQASLGSVGDSYDNALAENKNGPRKGLDGVERPKLTWVDWFNHRRLLKPIGDIPPTEYEKLYYQ